MRCKHDARAIEDVRRARVEVASEEGLVPVREGRRHDHCNVAADEAGTRVPEHAHCTGVGRYDRTERLQLGRDRHERVAIVKQRRLVTVRAVRLRVLVLELVGARKQFLPGRRLVGNLDEEGRVHAQHLRRVWIHFHQLAEAVLRIDHRRVDQRRNFVQAANVRLVLQQFLLQEAESERREKRLDLICIVRVAMCVCVERVSMRMCGGEKVSS